jgi:hypothetical protein
MHPCIITIRGQRRRGVSVVVFVFDAGSLPLQHLHRLRLTTIGGPRQRGSSILVSVLDVGAVLQKQLWQLEKHHQWLILNSVLPSSYCSFSAFFSPPHTLSIPFLLHNFSTCISRFFLPLQVVAKEGIKDPKWHSKYESRTFRCATRQQHPAHVYPCCNLSRASFFEWYSLSQLIFSLTL